MKKKSIYKEVIKTVIIILVLALLTSCKGTPESKIVNQKDITNFNKLITKKAKNKICTPKKYKDEFLSKDKKVLIKINSNVVVPEVEKFPVIKIRPNPISEDLVKWAIDEFMEGNQGYYPLMTKTKSDIEKWILRLESELADEKELLRKYGTKEEINEVKISYKQEIDKYKKMYINAPDEIQKIPTNLMFRPFKFYTEFDSENIKNELAMTEKQLINRQNCNEMNLYLSSDVKLTDGTYSRLTIFNELPSSINPKNESIFHMEKYEIHVSNSYIPHNIDFHFVLEDDPFTLSLPFGCLDDEYHDLSITKQEAINISSSIMNDIGLNNLYIRAIIDDIGNYYHEQYRKYKHESKEKNTLSRSEYFEEIGAKPRFYKIYFKPNYYGIPLLDANQMFSDETLYRSPIEYEEIVIRLAENKKLAEFKWINPTDISNVINDNVAIISFEEAIESAKRFMKLKYNVPTLISINPDNPDYNEIIDNSTSGEINIKEVKLGLAGIPAPNSTNEYLLIPVWNFYGSYSVNCSIDDYCRNNVELYYPILSINAIDGSIISQSAY